MFLFNEAAELLGDEINRSLAELKGVPGLYNLAREPLEKRGRGLALTNGPDRVWPCLPLLVSNAICGEYKFVLPAAAAFQFLFAAADVFDDIEDADKPDSLFSKYGIGAAVSTATTLLILGERSLTKLKSAGIVSDLVVCTIEAVNSFYVIACTGQHLDITMDRQQVNEEKYLKIALAKTASQIECICYSGALLAGANRELSEVFAVFGRNLGMASQLINDMQGILSGVDIKKAKMTLPVIFALTCGNAEVRSKLGGVYFDGPVTQNIDSEAVREWLFQTGAIHYATVKSEYYKQLAWDALVAAESTGVDVEDLKPFIK